MNVINMHDKVSIPYTRDPLHSLRGNASRSAHQNECKFYFYCNLFQAPPCHGSSKWSCASEDISSSRLWTSQRVKNNLVYLLELVQLLAKRNLFVRQTRSTTITASEWHDGHDRRVIRTTYAHSRYVIYWSYQEWLEKKWFIHGAGRRDIEVEHSYDTAIGHHC